MSSSSKNRGKWGQGQWGAPAGPTESVTGPGGKVNKYYADASLVPQTGGLVRPETGPGGPMQGIGLNFVKPSAGGAGRNQLAGMMPRPGVPTGAGGANPWSPTANVRYDRNNQLVVSDPRYRPHEL